MIADFKDFYFYQVIETSLFMSLVEHNIVKKGSIDIDDYNSIQRIMTNYFTSGIFKDYLGDKYTLAKLKDVNHYVMKDTKRDVMHDNLYVDSDFIDIMNDRYENKIDFFGKISELFDNIQDDIYDNMKSYFEKRKEYYSNCESIQPFLTKEDIDLKESFFNSKLGVNYLENFKSKSVQSLIKEKLGNSIDLEIIKHDRFSDHIDDIKKSINFNFYKDFDGTEYEFRKLNKFIYDELEFKYMPTSGRGTSEELDNLDVSWKIFKYDNTYAGGLALTNGLYSQVASISLKKSIETSYNYMKIIDSIINDDDCQKDLFLTALEIKSFNLEDQIRKTYSDKRIYFNHDNKNLFYDIYAFIEEKNLIKHKDEILDSFYKEIILLKEHEEVKFDDEYNIIMLIKFKDDLINKYGESDLKNNFDNRNEFVRYCYVKNNEGTFEDYLRHSISNGNMAFRAKLGSNLYDEIEKFVLENFPYFPKNIIEDLYLNFSINKQNSVNYNGDENYVEYSYHALYDFFIENNLLNNNNQTINIYRFENSDGNGIYRSDIPRDLDKNREIILNYSQRKTPSNDLNISNLFLNPNNRGHISNGYHSNYIFGFADKTQIYNWFDDDEIKKFINNNTKIYKYEVNINSAILSNYQVAFNKNNIISKEEIFYKDLLNIENKKLIKNKI